MRPVILLAFANDREGQFLRSLAAEQRSIQRALAPLVQKQLIEVKVLPQATAEDIFEAFRTYQDRIQVFHYGGHAGDLKLALSGSSLHVEGFAQFLSQQKGLALVFMNGCATDPQRRVLETAGIPHLILTETAISDRAAQQFASQFYQSLASGRRVGESFEEAAGATIAQARTFRWVESEAPKPENKFPWCLYSSTDAPFALPTQPPFPWKRVGLGLILLCLLVGGGYGWWKYEAIFDLRIAINYPLHVQHEHFGQGIQVGSHFSHQLILHCADQNLTVPLDTSGNLVFHHLTGQIELGMLHLESPFWELQDSLIVINRKPKTLQLDWKESLQRIKGRVLDRTSRMPLAGVKVRLGTADVEVWTDAKGNFELPISPQYVADILHNLTFEHVDYGTPSWPVNLAEGRARYDILLQKRGDVR